MYTVQRHGGAPQTCSQSLCCCGSPKQKALCDTAEMQGGQPRKLLCSSSSIRTEEGVEKFQHFFYVNYKFDEFVYLLEVMNSACDKAIANQPIRNAL